MVRKAAEALKAQSSTLPDYAPTGVKAQGFVRGLFERIENFGFTQDFLLFENAWMRKQQSFSDRGWHFHPRRLWRLTKYS
jgi:hypothetical protein